MLNFNFQVTALDRYSKVFHDLNDKASKAVRPLTSTWKSLGTLGKEMHLDKVGKGIQKITDGAVEMGERLGFSLAPLQALSDVGAAGGIAAGLGVVGAAIAGLAARAGNLGYETARTARNLGMSNKDLQAMRGAAELAGVSTEDMTASLANLGSVLHDAENGRNNDAVAMLNKLGISIKHTKDGAVDVTAAFTDLARAMVRVDDPYTQAVIASGFGVDRSLPLLKQGADGVERLTKKAEELGLVRGQSAIEWSEKFGDSLNRMKGAASGVANELGDKLVPAVTRMMDVTTGWLKGEHTSGAGQKQGDALDMLTAPFRYAFDLGNAAAVPNPTAPPVHSISGTIGPAPGSVSTPDSEVAWALRGITGPKDAAEAQAIYDQTRKVEVHVKVDAPPGAKVSATATSSSAFVPTRVSYSGVGGDGP